MEKPLEDKKHKIMCFRAFSSLKHRSVRSAEDIPCVVQSGSSASVDVASLRRTRSSTLPRMLKKDNQHTPQSLKLSSLFGSKAKQRRSEPENSTCGVKQKGNTSLHRRLIFPFKTGKTSPEEKQIVIPTICVQTPEEVELMLQLHPFAANLQQESPCHATQRYLQEKECMNDTQGIQFDKQKNRDKDQRNVRRQRKRSASWSGDIHSLVSRNGDPNRGDLKSFMSWSGFLNEDLGPETDLCSTDL